MLQLMDFSVRTSLVLVGQVCRWGAAEKCGNIHIKAERKHKITDICNVFQHYECSPEGTDGSDAGCLCLHSADNENSIHGYVGGAGAGVGAGAGGSFHNEMCSAFSLWLEKNRPAENVRKHFAFRNRDCVAEKREIIKEASEGERGRGRQKQV